MLVQRNLDIDLQLSFLERLDDIPERFCYLCPLHDVFITICSEVHHRNIEIRMYPACSFDTVPLLRFKAISPWSWDSASIMISRMPHESVDLKSRSFGIPTPLSPTISSNASPSPDLRIILISPDLPSGNAYFSELLTSSFIINPHGMAELIPRGTFSTSIFNAILFTFAPYDWARPYTRSLI